MLDSESCRLVKQTQDPWHLPGNCCLIYFTDEELDFIINYDIKYRMGQEVGEEE